MTVDIHKRANQAFVLKANVRDIEVVLESYLGNFKYNGESITKNPAVTRIATITTDILDYQLEFDPVKDHERFYGKLTTRKKDTIISEKFILDNHLDTHLRSIFNGKPLNGTLVGITESIKITETLLLLREFCEITKLNLVVGDKIRLIKKEEEI